MEGITLLVSIILIVFGVLQIILFFKLWGMTNDVRKLKNQFARNRSRIVKEIYKGNHNIENILFDAVYDEMERLYLTGNPELFDSVKVKYKPLYQKAGIEFPELFEVIHGSAAWRDAFINLR